MIMFGPAKSNTSEEVIDEDRDQIASSISQLLYYHSVQRARKGTVKRHDKSRETPVPVYLAMKIYGETRSKNLLKVTHSLGLSISYDRLQSILTEKANEVCTRYHAENVVCPPSLLRGVFTTAAADNVDHDTSSTTAKTSFHGTAISLMQHFQQGESGILRDEVTEEVIKSRRVLDIPAEYANVKPCFLDVRAGKYTSSEPCCVELTELNCALTQEEEWLENTRSGAETSLPWAAFHASRAPPTTLRITQTALLPIFVDSAHSVAMMLHAMNVVRDAIKHLNPEQVPVMVVDQPLYAICKQLQYTLPDTHGEGKFFVFLGGLHIEMAALKTIGQWLAGSGWEAALVQAEVTTQGRADSMLKATHITRTRYAHQVTAAALYSLQKDAYDNFSQDNDEIMTFPQWVENCRTRPQFKYWDIVLHLELTILQFVRAVRSADYGLYLEAISKLVSWFFSLDHVNYSRWLSVHIRDLVQVDQKNPDLAQQFRAGKFVARKSTRCFSAIALDQMHEQLNAQLKGDGGMVGITESPDALRKWMLAGPELAGMVSKFESVLLPDRVDEYAHHTQGKSSLKRNFNRDVNALMRVIYDLGNPFADESTNLYNIDTNRVMPSVVVETVMNIEEHGTRQYQDFVAQRLVTCSQRITDPIKLNKYPLFSSSLKKPAPTKAAAKLVGLKNDCSLFSRLFIACQSRSGDLDEFFSHENQPFPPAISDMGHLRSCKKSDLITCLVKTSENSTSDTAPQVSAKVLDGAAMVHMLQPRAAKNFQEYAQNEFFQYLKNECCSGVSRIDAVWDRYDPDSLKSGTREKRGTGYRTRVTASTRVPKGSWVHFLRDPDNKTELFELLAGYVTRTGYYGVEIISTLNREVLSSTGRTDLEMLQPCNHEEADTRILLHVNDAAAHGHSRVMVRTSDTDVLVLCVANCLNIDGLDELWVSIGTGKHHQFIAAHHIAGALGPMAHVLPVFHAFSGCDSVSSFHGKGKKTAFEAWRNHPNATEALRNLGCGNITLAMSDLQALVVTMYDRTTDNKTVNECRRKLFTTRNRPLDAIPPTLDALEQHALRAAYQGGHVWGQCLVADQKLPDPAKWGWLRCGDRWEPKWTTIPIVEEALMTLVKCGCKKGCTSRCKCKRANLPCTELCNCGGCEDDDLITE